MADEKKPSKWNSVGNGLLKVAAWCFTHKELFEAAAQIVIAAKK